MIKDYDKYDFSKAELLKYVIQSLIIIMIVGYLFYKSLIAIILLSPFTYFYLRRKKLVLIEKRKNQLIIQFKDAIVSIQGALNSGFAIERAFEEAVKDLSLLYDEESLIVKEFLYINNLLRINQTVEAALSDFANRSKIEDIQNFADVVAIAKRTGGNIISIIHNTTNNIGEKIEVERDIRTLFASKMYESKIMKLMPFFMILYLEVFSPSFLAPLYKNLQGAMIMSALLIVYCLAIIWTNKILKIYI